MKFIICIAGLAGLALPVLAQSPASALAQSPAAESSPLLHLSASFDLVVHAPYAVTAPLFGPEGERPWAGKHWNPQFIHPQPAADVEGAVFTIQHGPFHATWVNTLFDVAGRHFQYVYFMPDVMVTVIDVRFNPVSANETAVHVVYTRTALTQDGNEHVAAMNQDDKTAGKEWQEAIEEYLARAKSSGEQ
jgi:hypothetical protein